MSKPMTKPRHIAIYLRVSTDEQATSGLGLADQRERCLAYAQACHPGAEVRIYEDAGESAGSLDRPQLNALLEAVRGRHVGGIITLKIDRMARDLGDLLHVLKECEHYGAPVAFVMERIDASTDTGRLMLHILGAFAQFERSQIKTRTKAAVAQKLKRGLSHGYAPIGMRNEGGKRVPDAEEQHIVDLVCVAHHEGLSLREIASALTEAGHPTKRGGAWQACTISQILKRATKQQAA